MLPTADNNFDLPPARPRKDGLGVPQDTERETLMKQIFLKLKTRAPRQFGSRNPAAS